jgi:Ferritin-like domain
MPPSDPQARLAGSRRAFIRLTGATFLGGSAAAVAACGGGGGKDKTETTVSTTQAQGDAAVLNAALVRAISRLGTQPVAPRSVAAYAQGFPPLRTPSQFLNFALDVENTAVAAYLDSMAALNTDPLRAEVASIMTNEAEHMAVISGLLLRPQVPNAFVTGESPS